MSEKASCPMGAGKCVTSHPFRKYWQTNRPSNQQTNGHEGSMGSYASNRNMYRYFIFQLLPILLPMREATSTEYFFKPCPYKHPSVRFIRVGLHLEAILFRELKGNKKNRENSMVFFSILFHAFFPYI